MGHAHTTACDTANTLTLVATNAQKEYLNTEVLTTLFHPEQIFEIKSNDSMHFEDITYGEEYLNSADLKKINKADKHISPTLMLAPGCKIVLTKNVSQYMKQVNGTPGIFEGFLDDKQEVLLFTNKLAERSIQKISGREHMGVK